MVQLHKMTNSELLSTEQVAVTARAIPVPNKSIYAGYSYITSDFLGAVDIAMTGVWAGGILSQAEKWIWLTSSLRAMKGFYQSRNKLTRTVFSFSYHVK